MAEQGAKAFQSGDMSTAAAQYLLASRTDPDEPNYLYGAARAEQASRQFDAAERHYQAYAGNPRADATRVAKVRQYLQEIRGERAQQRAVEAERLAQKGDAVLAAPTWLEAYQLAPDRPQYLLSAALAAREAGETASAIAHLETFLKVAPADMPERAKATALLQQMRKPAEPLRAPAPVAPVSHPPQTAVIAQSPVPAQSAVIAPAPVPNSTPDSAPMAVSATAPTEAGNTRTAGLWTFIGGVAVGVAGLGTLVWGLSEQTTLNQELGYADGAVHTSLSRDEALARASTTATHQTIGAVLSGLGVAATGVGLWLWLRTPQEKESATSAGTVVLTGNGVAWTARF